MNHASPDIFSPGMSNDTRGGSPSDPPNSMPIVPASSLLAQAHERANQIRMAIQNEENMANQLKLKVQRAQTVTEEDRLQHAKLMAGVNQKKEYLVKLVAMIQQGSMPQQLPGGGSGAPGPSWGSFIPTETAQHMSIPTQRQVNQVVSFAHHTIQDLQSMGVPEHVVELVEACRPGLQRLYQQQDRLTRVPTKDQTQFALARLEKLRSEAQEAIHHLQPVEIPPSQRAAYNALLESVHRMTLDFDPKLPILYSLIKNDNHMRRIVKIISSVQLQRNLCSQNSPRVIISFEALRACQTELVRINDAFSLAMKQADAMRQNQHGHPQQSSIQTVVQNYVAQQQGMNEDQLVRADGSGLDPQVDPLIEALSDLRLP